MFKVVDHPLIKDKLTRMRKETTLATIFRSNLEEITFLLAYEATKNMTLREKIIKTPITECIGYKLVNKVCLVPILRAGLGMVDSLKSLIPTASIGHLGLYRDEKTLLPVSYYEKLPKNIGESDVLILDPMLATGHTAAKAIEIIKKYKPNSITFICILASPEGVTHIEKIHPDVAIYAASLDTKLNSDGYIDPGLGDAGDRLFGTK